jgi:ppGpp synthetase/RelA/SpoT-type nucleotidyltranferase
MEWTKPEGYSKNRVDWAGNILINEISSKEDRNKAISILDNWRAVHRYPMHIFKKRLKNVSEKMDKEAFAVQRLKRLPSIIKKLQRVYQGDKPTMKLSQMQDIAGCRVVMPTIKQARELYEKHYLKGHIKHLKVNEKDYMMIPKKDGYRSIHLIYRYNSDKEGKKDFNNLLIEVQIRSKLQHLWATAIEIVDFFTRQAIKSNEGQKEWIDFFRLVSSAFAIIEGTPTIPGTPKNKKELYSQIKIQEEKLQVIKVMEGWTHAVKVFQEVTKEKPRVQFFLLELDVGEGRLNLRAYTKEQEKMAIIDYNQAEKRNQEKKAYDVVLVGADTTNDLKKAYPNYFVDSEEFLEKLQKIINKVR